MWQKVKNYYHFLRALAAAIYFNFPSKNITVIGVTGTDGKTTTVSMINHILKEAGYKTSMISSVSAIIADRVFDTGLHVTTPGPFAIQRFLKEATRQGNQYFVLEVTSHGLDQNRLGFVKFTVAVLTNISREHLDYHKSLVDYMKAKSKLFQNVSFSVLNLDDQSFNFFKKISTGKKLTYGMGLNADFNPNNFPLNLKIFGNYNLQNALAAGAAATALGISKKDIIKALSTFKNPKGRMQEVNLGQKFKVYIDFAHTPNGLENALKFLHSIRTSKSTRIISVFGSAGERDREKRPRMGKVASKFSDISILTAEDPRSENVNKICLEIAKGFAGKRINKDYFIIDSRQIAIDYAVKIAKKGDIVAFFGKGHEKSMSFKHKELSWDEFKIARSAILKK